LHEGIIEIKNGNVSFKVCSNDGNIYINMIKISQWEDEAAFNFILGILK